MKKVKRLYADFHPERYELYLEPDRDKAEFSGRVVINGHKVGRPSKRLTFHQKGLKISKAALTKHDKSGDEIVDLQRTNVHKSLDELRLHSREMLYPGSYTIEIDFSGRITDPMHGIYPCNFELDGRKHQLIATQFESHHAREVFPCIDEPEAKAVFSLSLETPSDEIVIANTPVLSSEKKAKSIITTFEDTPIMSTYLLAFVYGQLGYTEAKTKNGVKVRVYATPDKVKLTDFALDVSVKALEFFEEYFGVPYPLPKLDVIGLPDFSSGAMENWGLITFREQVLYVDPKSSTIDTKQFVAMVVCHEIAHQWFGNLVTMKWWNDLWLNESFANLMEYRAVDEIFPEWRIWEEFTAREMGQALTRDALPNVQAVRTEVNHPDELSSLFDPSIVYAKGGCLLNMVRHLIGETAFRAGLRSYFIKFKYQNTEASDLWNHLAEASKMEIGQIMRRWLSVPGYPMLEVKYDAKSSNLSLSQERLVIGKAAPADSGAWDVPLASSIKLDQPLLKYKKDEFKAQSVKDNYPLVLNHEAHSYFVPHYTNSEHFESILKAAKANKLSPIDRLLLVQAYVLMERAGRVPISDNLRLLEAFANEREESVWSVLGGIIGGARTLNGKNKVNEAKLNAVIRRLAEPLVKELGWRGTKNESSQTQKFRSLAIGLSAGAEDPAVIKKGLELFAKFKKPADLSPDIRSNVYFIAVRYGKKSDFDRLVSLYKEVSNAEEKEEIASQLTATRDPAQIKSLLKMMSSTEVRLQDMPTWFAWLMINRYAVEYAWEWLNSHWQWIEDKYGSDKSYDRFPRYAAMAFSYPDQLESYKKFFEPKANTALARAIKLGIEEIEGRLAWRTKNEAGLAEWFSQLP